MAGVLSETYRTSVLLCLGTALKLLP